MYKNKRYHVRPLADILEDIDMARKYYTDFGSFPTGVPNVTRVFLCDGDAIAMDTGDLLTILEKLYKTFPRLERVTTYVGPKSTLRKTPEALKALREAGLTRAYLGMETGWGDLLKKVGKGVTAEEMLEAGTRIREAGMELWDIILLGLAGPGEASRTHIQKSVEMINAMRPRHLSAMTYTPVEGTPMYNDVMAGRFTCLTPREALLETKWLVEGLKVDPLHITANHPSNYLPIKGGLPEDRERILALIDSALDGETAIREGRPRVL
jgi:radical SAM superfamily enzyme YgiQ (UPF0313 family)